MNIHTRQDFKHIVSIEVTFDELQKISNDAKYIKGHLELTKETSDFLSAIITYEVEVGNRREF